MEANNHIKPIRYKGYRVAYASLQDFYKEMLKESSRVSLNSMFYVLSEPVSTTKKLKFGKDRHNRKDYEYIHDYDQIHIMFESQSISECKAFIDMIAHETSNTKK